MTSASQLASRLLSSAQAQHYLESLVAQMQDLLQKMGENVVCVHPPQTFDFFDASHLIVAIEVSAAGSGDRYLVRNIFQVASVLSALGQCKLYVEMCRAGEDNVLLGSEDAPLAVMTALQTLSMEEVTPPRTQDEAFNEAVANLARAQSMLQADKVEAKYARLASQIARALHLTA